MASSTAPVLPGDAPAYGRVWQLRDNLTAYDAVYIALAEALSTVLVTGDRKLVGAPRVGVAIELI